MKEKSMSQKLTAKEISRMEYCNWWAQKKGYKSYSEYCTEYQRLHDSNRKYYPQRKEKKRKYNQEHKEHIIEWRKQNYLHIKEARKTYYKTPNGKIACKKSLAKRQRELEYYVINIDDVINLDYVGHHLDKKYVLYMPNILHKSIWHRRSNKKSMNKINTVAIEWYIKQKGFVIKW